MWMRMTRWAVAALVGSAMTTIGCAGARPTAEPGDRRAPEVTDYSVVHAFDTSLEMRLIDRLDLDRLLRDRPILISVDDDGVVELRGEVWTTLERVRADHLVRDVVGVVDVSNHLVVRPPD